MPETQLTLMAVHAHPDDETTSGGGSLVKYAAEGVQTILVTCTDGAEGEIHDPELNPEEARPRLAQIRTQELARANKIMNISHTELLEYADSGMAGTPPNENPASFHQADLREATGRLVKLVRKYRPQVMFSYNSFGGYGHPDHIKAHKIATGAFDQASNLLRYAEAEFGPAWQPSKFYTTAWSGQNFIRVWEAMKANGEDWPFRPPPKEGDIPAPPQTEEAPEFGSPENEITTIIDVRDYYNISQKALYEHRTQINPENPFWKMMQKYGEIISGQEYFILFKSNIPARRPEYDLFEGIRQGV